MAAKVVAENGSKMDPEIKAKWLDALRSGDYTQGRSFLAVKNEDTDQFDFCCLGVLCDLAVNEGVIAPPIEVDAYENDPWNDAAWVKGFETTDQYTVLTHGLETRTLPAKVRKWAGFTTDNPAYVKDFETCGKEGCECGGPQMHSLASENDAGISFAGIADIIEEHL